MVGLVGRERELGRLAQLWDRPRPALALVYGRRGIGKTYFLQRALDGRRGIYFLAAESSSLENLEELLAQIRRAFPLRTDVTPEHYPTWGVALRLLCQLATSEPLLVVFDEFDHLVGVDPSLPTTIQTVWDHDARTSQIKLILCGSQTRLLGALDDQGWPLHRRFDWVHQLQPLDYYDAAQILHAAAPRPKYQPRDMLLAYGLYGGHVRYLAAINPALSLGENVARLTLDPLGAFHREGENLIRRDRDVRDYGNYNAVLSAIAGGATDWSEIAKRAYLAQHVVAGTLDRLRQLGWVTHVQPFEEPNRRGTYRLEDNFLSFWFHFVFRQRSILQIAPPRKAWKELVEPFLGEHMDRCIFTTICAQHLRRFGRAYGLDEVVASGGWWSRASDIRIDLVGQLDNGRYLVAECNWASQPTDVTILADLRRKLASKPPGRWATAQHQLVFSATGFTRRLIEQARAENVILIGPDQFIAGLEED